MKIALICLNLFAGFLIFPAMLASHELYFMAFSSGYAELDRAQIIDKARLKEVYPNEFENDRYMIPRLFLRGAETLRWFVFTPIIIAFGLNAIFIALFWKNRKVEPASLANILPHSTREM